jgi:hypothetical protein
VPTFHLRQHIVANGVIRAADHAAPHVSTTVAHLAAPFDRWTAPSLETGDRLDERPATRPRRFIASSIRRSTGAHHNAVGMNVRATVAQLGSTEPWSRRTVHDEVHRHLVDGEFGRPRQGVRRRSATP